MRIGRSVVGWDGSVPAEHALRWAADRAERTAGALHLVRVLPPADGAAAPAVVAGARAELEDEVSALERSYPDLPVSVELAVGDTGHELMRIADRNALLVVGASRSGRGRRPLARRVPVAIAGRADGVTAVVPDDPPGPRSGVVAAVRGRGRSSGALTFAANAAVAVQEPLTLLRIREPFEPAEDGEHVTLDAELTSLERSHPGLDVRVDRRWVRSPISLLTLADGATLLVLEGDRPSAAPPRFSMERWLAGQARAPFVVVAEPLVQESDARALDRTGLTLAG